MLFILRRSEIDGVRASGADWNRADGLTRSTPPLAPPKSLRSRCKMGALDRVMELLQVERVVV